MGCGADVRPPARLLSSPRSFTMVGRHILVTGADGFVGRHLCAELVRRNADVHALVRRPSSVPVDGVRYLVGELADAPRVLQQALPFDAVVHLAARVHVMHETVADPAKEFHRVNVAGTERLLDAVLGSSAPVVLFVSSVKALGIDGDRDAYGRSKLAAEQLITTRSEAAGGQGVVLRLPLVYGAGMRGNMLRLFDAVDRGLLLPLGSIRNQRSLVGVGNVVAAICLLLESPSARGTLTVRDAHNVSTPELVRAVARALDRPPRLIPVPAALFALAGRVGDLLSAVLPMPFTSMESDRLLGSLIVENFTVDGTPFYPPVSLEEGLAATARWYRSRSVV